MPYRADALTLRLHTPFRLSKGVSTERSNAVVSWEGAYGEAALPPYYPHRLDDVLAYLRGVKPSAFGDAEALERALDRIPPGPAPARAALDVLLHDRWGRRLGHPLHVLWGLSPADAPPTSITLSIERDLDVLAARVRERADWPVLKMKLGSGDPDHDVASVYAARAAYDGALCVDANGAWTVDEAVRAVGRLGDADLLFVEEPLADRSPEAWAALRRRLPAGAAKLMADESVQTAADVLALGPHVDGINVKIAKAGGLRPARALITLARALDLEVLLGCMVESAVAVTAAAHLAPLADYADLDAPLLVADDPFVGVTVDAGRLQVPTGPGLGVRPAARLEA